MTNTSAINVNTKAATYNAVKIQINDPRTNISEGFKSTPDDNGVYNAVAIEVNRPKVEAGHKHHSFYDYPCAECLVTSDKAPIKQYQLPKMPVLPPTFQTTNFISNKTLINAEIEVENDNKKNIAKPNKNVAKENTQKPEAEIVIIEQITSVPKPNLTTVEAEKKVIENGTKEMNFKANPKKPIEIVPSTEIKPSVNIPNTIKNLSSENYDIQAQQMEDIARVSMEDAQKAVPYIVTEVFSELINIVNKDTSKLTPPSQKQIETRKQIIINELVKEKARSEKQDLKNIELPYEIKKEDIKEASILSPMEQAERNKEYALYTIAILSKVYTDEVQRHTGNVVPLTDLPGISDIVNSLKLNNNPSIKIAAIDALRYINKPEYKEEIQSILKIAQNDENPYVAKIATKTLENI